MSNGKLIMLTAASQINPDGMNIWGMKQMRSALRHRFVDIDVVQNQSALPYFLVLVNDASEEELNYYKELAAAHGQTEIRAIDLATKRTLALGMDDTKEIVGVWKTIKPEQAIQYQSYVYVPSSDQYYISTNN